MLSMKENHFIDNLLQESMLSGKRLPHRPRRLLKLFERLLEACDSEFGVRFLLAIKCGHSDKRSRHGGTWRELVLRRISSTQPASMSNGLTRLIGHPV